MIKVYVSGAMTGVPMKNKPAFDAAQHWLELQGYLVINPTNKPNEILTREATPEEYYAFMRQDIYDILYKDGGVQEIWFLPGWEKSRGARYEMHTAKICGLKIKFVPQDVITHYQKEAAHDHRAV